MSAPDPANASDTSTLSLERFSAGARGLIVAAQALADERKHAEVLPLHVLAAGIGRERLVADGFRRAGIDPDGLARNAERLLARLHRSKEPAYLAPPTLDLIERAEREAVRAGRSEVSTADVLNALSQEIRGALGELFRSVRLEPGGLRHYLAEPRPDSDAAAPAQAGSGSPRTSTGVELFRPLAESQGHVVIERKADLSRLLTVLEREGKHHPLLVGEPGVGKHSLLLALAARIARGDVSKTLAGVSMVEFDSAALTAGARLRGEIEERLRKAFSSLGHRSAEPRIVVIRELDQLASQGSFGNAVGDLLRAALENGELRLIATTTPEGRRLLEEREPFLLRLLSVLAMDEPSAAEAVQILTGISQRLEKHHRFAVSEAAISAAVGFARRYVQDRFLPDSAIDLLDEAMARRRIDGQAGEAGSEALAPLSEADVARSVALSTGIPVQRLLEGEAERLLHFEERLSARLIGQDHAVTAIARAVRRGRVGLRDPRRPIGSFLFLGPSGVGKTELAKVMAELLFDDEHALTRLDMSEFMERHMAQRLIGAPPGYADSDQGGFLTEAVRRRPYSALLFDEVEKAHHDVFNLLLQVLDEGRLTDGRGRLADFSNTVVVLTSNIGSNLVLESDASVLESESGRERLRETLLAALSSFFRPELLNRIDEVVVFRPLSRADLSRIVDLRLAEVERLLAHKRLRLEVSAEAKERLVELGYEPALGARPLRRTVLRHIQDPLAEAILRGEIADGATVSVETDAGQGFSLSAKLEG